MGTFYGTGRITQRVEPRAQWMEKRATEYSQEVDRVLIKEPATFTQFDFRNFCGLVTTMCLSLLSSLKGNAYRGTVSHTSLIARDVCGSG